MNYSGYDSGYQFFMNNKEEIFSNDEIIADILDFLDEGDEKKTRFRIPRTDYKQSYWWTLINDPRTANPSSYHGKQFRAKFRVPLQLFQDEIVPQCIAHNVFETKRFTKNYEDVVKLKVLACLRIIGRGVLPDDAAEMSNNFFGRSTVNSFFLKFLVNFSSALYDEFIHPPTDERLQVILEIYRRLGMPGAVGSLDGTTFWWLRCPEYLRHECLGKDPDPSLGFHVVCDFTRFIHYCSGWFYGGVNDITKTKNDPYPRSIMQGLYNNIEYVLYDKDGIPYIVQGGYIIVDGGYIEIPCFMNPVKRTMNGPEILWSEMLESVRKDIECTFGVLKQRFRILRNGITLQTEAAIEALVKTCCIINNMLLIHDGLYDRWEDNINWEKLSPDFNDEQVQDESLYTDAAVVEPNMRTFINEIAKQNIRRGTSFVANYTPQHQILRDALIVSYNKQYNIGETQWPRKLEDRRKRQLDLVKRQKINLEDALYHKPSLYKAFCIMSKDYSSDIGEGLYSMISYQKDDLIAEYQYEVINEEEGLRREALGNGGYMHLLGNQLVDCYNWYVQGRCKASYANTATNIRDPNDPTKVIYKNAEIRYSLTTNPKTIKIYAIKSIPSNTEILVTYSMRDPNFLRNQANN